MDPLSISASVAGILSLSQQVISAAFKYVQAVRGAEKEIASFVAEITGLFKVLREIEGLATALDGRRDNSTSALRDALTGCKTTLESIRKQLEASDPAADSKAALQKFTSKLKWPFTSSKNAALIRELERQKSALSLALMPHTIATSLRLEDRLEETLEVQIEMRREQTEMHRAQTALFGQFLVDTQKMLHDNAALLLEYGSQQSITPRKALLPSHHDSPVKENAAISAPESRILEAFTEIDSTQVYERILAVVSNGSTEWIFEKLHFQGWLHGRERILWLRGGPGTGKTVLTAKVVNKLIVEHTDHLGNAVAFFLCQYRDHRQREKAVTILSSFAAQLASQSLRAQERLEAFYNEHSMSTTGISELTTEDLQELVLSMSYDFKTVFLVVDGLDEWWQIVDNDFDQLMGLSRHCRRIRMFLASRAYPDFEKAFRGHRSIDAAASQQLAIETYVKNEVESRLTHIQADLRNRIKAQLLEQSGGMFIWVRLVLRELENARTAAEVASILDRQPLSLMDTYGHIFDGIIEDHRPVVSRMTVACLLVLAAPHDHSYSPVQLLEAAGRLARVENTASMRLNGLIPLTQLLATQDEDGSVNLAHMSLVEYINSHRDDLEAYLESTAGHMEAGS